MILKEFIGREDAFLSILTLPFLMDTSLMSNFIGILALLALLNVIKKKTFASYLLLWISLALICLYRLDIGFASTLSAIVLLGYLWITNRKTYDLKKMMLSLFLVLLPFACFFFGVCFLKNINPLLRIIEFLKISLSNNNWAYSAFGSPSTYAYYLFYYIMPIAVLLSLFYLLAKKGKNLEKKDLILVFFALYFIFNFQRGLIRHSLVEKTMQGALSYFILYFSLFLSTLKPQAKARPVVAYACILILFSMTLSLDFINFNSLAIDVQSKELSYTLEDERQNSKVERIVLDKTMKKEYQNLKTVLSILLKENETYLDFTNQTLLYAILGYDNPVYINQSPGLLSGEYTQQLFLEEIKNYQGNVPIALKVRTNSDNQMNNFRITLDEVANEMRYYLVSEYIYQHYAYLGCVDDFEIWIEKGRMEDAKKMLLQNQISLEQNEENQEEPYRLDYIPYIWGEMEKIQEKEIETVSLQTTASSISFKVHPTLPKEKVNYLLFQITNQGALSKETISLQSLNKTLSQIDFYVLPGTHTYKIRISSIKSWYEDDLDTITFTKKEDYEMTKLVIAEGDTLKQIN